MITQILQTVVAATVGGVVLFAMLLIVIASGLCAIPFIAIIAAADRLRRQRSAAK